MLTKITLNKMAEFNPSYNATAKEMTIFTFLGHLELSLIRRI